MRTVAKVATINGADGILRALDRVRERVLAGETIGFAYASSSKDGSISYGYQLAERDRDRHTLAAAVSVLFHRYMTGYDNE